MSRAVISINAGSSSIKFGLFAVEGGGLVRTASALLQGIGIAPRVTVRDREGATIFDRTWPDGAALTHEHLLDRLYHLADGQFPRHDVVAVGHRVVHGGTAFTQPWRVDADVLAALEELAPLAPLHQPHNLSAIRAVAAVAPDLPQVACFDTAFHGAMPALSTRMALPAVLRDRGIRRYGFHGLSYEFIAQRLREVDPGLAGGRVIAAHLGNGASLCAMAAGRSVDTTMGFTALDGLVMGTRCGAIDPGVILHLIERCGMTAAEVEAMLYQQCGLLGLSGVSSDVRILHASDDPRAADAIAQFAWSAARQAGALMTSLGGLDGLVFTAGIGENDPAMRQMICDRLAFAGVRLDPVANAANAPLISADDSRVTVRVIPTDEELMIAMHCLRAIGTEA